MQATVAPRKARDLTLARPSRATRFAARDPGPAARLSGFVGHLRENGFRLGVAEAEVALTALACVADYAPDTVRLALKTVLASSSDEARRFDALFDAYWLNAGRVRPSASTTKRTQGQNSRRAHGDDSTGSGQTDSPDEGDAKGEANADGTGKLVASEAANLMRKDLRKLVAPQDIREAEAIAAALGRAIRDRRSRRRRAARRGQSIDLRRTMRASLATGGEPFRLVRRRRPDRPVRIVTLCDVSGSMTAYARPYLAFVAGLMRADPDCDAWLFHTRLVRISEALRDDDPLRVLNRLTLLAEGFGGGSMIGANLDRFARGPARHLVNGRTVVLILSDGYDTGDPAQLGAALARLRKRGCRVIWLNPLKGWKDYSPVARGMAAALPSLDLFAPAATLADFAALEPELARL
ncbi:MAG: Protein containing von Willebrand factor type A (vWA) domain [Rhodobacteraceae bacterium HLUCCA12]|nr:MAG: Protein containing von Willebrand factor type A (vWA) domain [Rhodobacteraceae bacterium HLUCCA12]